METYIFDLEQVQEFIIIILINQLTELNNKKLLCFWGF